MKKNKGAVSVLLCVIFLSVVIAVGAAADACSLATANAYAKRMNYMACKSVLAEYDLHLFEDYGLMAFNGGSYEIQEKVDAYIRQMARVSDNPGDEIVFFDLEIDEISIDSSGSSLVNQQIFMGQISELMKYKSIEIGVDKFKEYISGKNDVGSKVSEAKNGLQKEKEASSASSDEGSNGDSAEKREAVSLNNRSFESDDESADRVLRSHRVIDSLPSENIAEKREKRRYGLGEEDELMELGEDSSDFMDGFYKNLSSGAEKLALLEYIKLYFKNSVSVPEKAGETFFTNEIEYILKGNCSDAENKADVKRDLFLMRTALNLTHIYSDAEKRQITLEAALATGAGPYAAAVQFVFAAAWAGAEAKSDIDILYRGEKVPFMKDRSSWKLDFDSIGAAEQVSGEYEGGKGLDYGQYLQLMMLMCSKEKLAKRTMDLIQINMKGRYNIQFDLRNCITSFKAKSDFHRISFIPSVLPGIIEDNAMSIEGVFAY